MDIPNVLRFHLITFQVGLINHGKEDFGAEIARTLSSEITIALRPKTSDAVDTNNSDDESDSVPKSIIADAPNRTVKIIDFSMSLSMECICALHCVHFMI